MNLDHKHIIVTATVNNPPITEKAVIDWLTRLVEAVGMRIVIGPFAKYVDNPGVEGVTAVVCIETSHASIHIWDATEPPYIKFDLYSCKTFDPVVPIQMFDEFDPIQINWNLYDRNTPIIREIGQGVC